MICFDDLFFSVRVYECLPAEFFQVEALSEVPKGTYLKRPQRESSSGSSQIPKGTQNYKNNNKNDNNTEMIEDEDIDSVVEMSDDRDDLHDADFLVGQKRPRTDQATATSNSKRKIPKHNHNFVCYIAFCSPTSDGPALQQLKSELVQLKCVLSPFDPIPMNHLSRLGWLLKGESEQSNGEDAEFVIQKAISSMFVASSKQNTSEVIDACLDLKEAINSLPQSSDQVLFYQDFLLLFVSRKFLIVLSSSSFSTIHS